jgi:hypothetical protein
MKKLVIALSVIMLLGSCSIFKRKEKLGCPNDARNMTQEQILKASNKKKFKV